MLAVSYYKNLRKKLSKRNDIKIESYRLNYKNGSYEFLKISSKYVGKNDRIILIVAGIHGEEIAGPLTILNYANNIIDQAHKKGLKLIIYPLVNPSGFDKGSRFNIDDEEGTFGNNIFLLYELTRGEIVDEIKKNQKFKNWYWASNKKFKFDIPKETKLFLKLLRKDPYKQVVAVVDLHQDYFLKHKKGAYQYSFGDLTLYKDITNEIKKRVPIIKNRIIASGYRNDSSEPYNKNGRKSDENGFIVRHDGTLLDLFHRLGAKYCVTPETTGTIPIKKACEINMLWIKGIIDLI